VTQNQKSYDSAAINKLDKSRVEITGSIPADVWEKHRAAAVKHVGEHITIDGFRKGMIPESILVAKVGDSAIREEMAELALSRTYFDILIDNKIDAIGRPEIQVTKLAAGNPLEFKIITAVVPEISLPDYRKIADENIRKQKLVDEKFTDQELRDTISSIQSAATPQTLTTSKDPVSHPDNINLNKASAPDSGQGEKPNVLPDLTDDYVKKLGAFSDVRDFKDKVGEMIIQQKRDQAHDKKRIAIADAITAATPIDLPEVMIESEINRTESQFKADIEKMGVKLEDYMKHAKKTIEEIRQEWRPYAEKKAKLQLILNAIAQKEHTHPDKGEVESEVKHILDHYKDADVEKARAYAETVLTNEKVFQFLEGAEPKPHSHDHK
jgi:trigger factor